MSRHDPPVTIETVAARAGVGRGTASRVLTGSPRVSEAAVRAVRRAAAELGYRPNAAARSLVTGRTGLVGLVVAAEAGRLASDPYFARLARAVHDELAGADHVLVLTVVAGPGDRERLLDLAATRLDGLLLANGDAGLARSLDEAGAVVVHAGRTPPQGPSDGSTWVDADSLGGSRAAVAHLVARGRTRIATVTGDLALASGQDRLAGWREGLREAGLPHGDDLVAGGDYDRAVGARAVERLLDADPAIDALFCASDLMALGALDVLARLGRRVPDDVAVVGFDDDPVAAAATPPLTTVRQDVDAMGRRMARLLLERLAGRTAHVQEVLPTHLVVRESG